MPITIDIEKDYLYQKGLKKGLEEGDTEGEARKTHQAAENMLKKGYAITAICEVLEVPKDYILKIKEELGLS